MSDDEIAEVLTRAMAGLEPVARTRAIYNEAIDDAANFLRDVVPHNPMAAAILLSAEREVRKLALSSALEAAAREGGSSDP